MQQFATAATRLENDIYEINRVMNIYCWSLDTRDWERLATCFTDDMQFEASNMGRYDDPRALISAFQTRTIRQPVRRHMITNPYVRVDGDTAEFTSNLQNIRIRPEAPGGDFFLGGGYYRNSFRRTQSGWKISKLRWEAVYMEGNSRLDPSLPPMQYLPVMASNKDAPWGGARSAGTDGPRSANQQIRDLCIGLFRAIDAKVEADALASFDDDATASIDGTERKGAKAIYEALVGHGSSWTVYDLWNEKYAAADDEGLYCAYVYNVTGDGTRWNVHCGGVIHVEVSLTTSGWRVRTLEYVQFWQRGTPIYNDPIRTISNYQRITIQPWRLEGRRQSLRDEDEVVALMSKYTWNYDFWNFDKVAECFTEDVEGTFVTDSTKHFSGLSKMIPGIRANHEKQPYMQHYCTNFVVNMGIDGESAEMKCYASSRRTDPGGGQVFVAGGRYDAYARKLGGTWKFLTFQYTRIHGAYDGEQPAP